MARLVVNEELKFGRVEYVSPNRDWAKVTDLHTGTETFIHVYEKAELHALLHHSNLPFVAVPEPYGRTPGLSVPVTGTLIRFKAGNGPEYRPRALAWVTADEWIECMNLLAGISMRENELIRAVREQEALVVKMFDEPIREPYQLFG